MVWRSQNKGHFWSDEEKYFYLNARRRVRANQRQRTRRLYRRLVWIALAIAGVALAARVARSASPQGVRETATIRLPELTQTQVVTVTPGDSLWSIARRYSPKGTSTMDNIAVISALNGNPNGQLEPGQRLVVPATP
ncbi:LysM peptidoglycan-binding domain-containing protein [Armatimonas sp.]|uniref:LysM peptidoglycan-binding domain-containing protein n=1 Tax=Armatimonas sp. TaxID=1872638 RepID=UPI00286B28F1|nr:LysM peptidoglycan-binding domain-containing protein [Armatimonas sp.]